MIDPLFEHQDTGATDLASHTRRYLGDDPGLGKTRTAVVAMNRAGTEHALIIAPAAVRSQWVRELQRNADFRWDVWSYDHALRANAPCDVDTLALDEAHYLKHAGAQRTRKILSPKTGLVTRIPRVYPLSGTPIPKHPGEFWTILVSLWPEVAIEHGLRTAQDWENRFLVTMPRWVRGHVHNKVVGTKNDDELREILDRVMLRRTIADVGIDVPSIWWQELRLDAPSGLVPSELSDRGIVTDATGPLLEAIRFGAALDDLENDPEVARVRRKLGELKAPLVADLVGHQLEETDEKIVLFAHHTSVLDALEHLLDPHFGVVRVDGDTPMSWRPHKIDFFISEPKERIFLAQNTAVGTGTDRLQHATNRAILVEPSWSAYENVQMGRRVARIGSAHDHAIVQMAILAGTLDDYIVAQNLRETRMLETTIGGEGTR